MTARAILATAQEWTFRTAALREARTRVVGLGERRERALAQARLLLEVAQRVKHPVERLPKGTRPGVLLGLYRDAIYWALAAHHAGDLDPSTDLPALWAKVGDEELARAAGGSATLEAARRAIFDLSPARSFEVSADDAARAGTLATALVDRIDAPRKRADRLVAQRWRRVLLIVAVLVAVTAGVRRLQVGPDLAAGITPRVSSSWSGCASDPPCTALLFHTDPEANPWVEFDLGAKKTVRKIEVTNRDDCCGERAIPLVAEVSTDRLTWTQVGRRDLEFSKWTASFKPVSVRYVRLRVARQSTFHLKEVAIR
jgi:hypothetical protein